MAPDSPYNWRSPQNDNLWQGVSGTNNPCPAGFRLPTSTELDVERASWGANSSVGAFASPLKLVLAGFRYTDGSLDYADSGGGYWSSTVGGNGAHHLGFASDGAIVGSSPHAGGYSVRCIKANNPVPDCNGDIDGAAYIDSCGFCVGGDTGNTSEVTCVTSAGQIWMDRNLGSSQVATSFDDAAAYGDLYQWGRGTDGHEKLDSNATSETSDTDSPGHGDFIDVNSDWRTTPNNDLWQGISGINNPCPSGFRLPTLNELTIERMSWASGNPDGAGSEGRYWSSDLEDDGPGNQAYYELFNFTTYAQGSPAGRATGASVCCIKD